MLRRVEQALQAALEKPFSRLFPQQLQPGELKAPLREALESSARRAGLDSPLPPRVGANRYTIELNADDAAQAARSGPEFAAELAADLEASAREGGIRIGPYASVLVQSAADVAANEVRIRAEFALRPGARVVGEAGLPEPGRVVPLGERSVIGRSPDCDIVVGEGAVSRHHCEIVWADVEYVLRDLASANGTFVNGEQVQVAPLRDGDLVEIGFVRLRFSDQPR